MSIDLLIYVIAVLFCILDFFNVPNYKWLSGAIGLVILATWVI